MSGDYGVGFTAHVPRTDTVLVALSSLRMRLTLKFARDSGYVAPVEPTPGTGLSVSDMLACMLPQLAR